MLVLKTLLRGAMTTAVVLIALIAAVPGRAANEPRIAVLLSYNAAPAEEMLDGFREELRRQGVDALYSVHPLEGSPDEARLAIEEIQGRGYSLILALGSLAVEALDENRTGIPVVASLVMREQDIRRVGNATGVFLEFPIRTQFQWIKSFLPETKNIGVVYNPEENGDFIAAAAEVARTMGMQLMASEASTPRELPAALESLTNRADLLWGITDSVVVTPQTAKDLLLFSFRHRIPFIGLSTAWVKSGAFFALDRDYQDIGRQCARMAADILTGRDASSLPPAPPSKVTFSINLRTAEQMKVKIPPSLRSQAENLY